VGLAAGAEPQLATWADRQVGDGAEGALHADDDVLAVKLGRQVDSAARIAVGAHIQIRQIGGERVERLPVDDVQGARGRVGLVANILADNQAVGDVGAHEEVAAIE
jgi:hypothetical protein